MCVCVCEYSGSKSQTPHISLTDFQCGQGLTGRTRLTSAPQGPARPAPPWQPHLRGYREMPAIGWGLWALAFPRGPLRHVELGPKLWHS